MRQTTNRKARRRTLPEPLRLRLIDLEREIGLVAAAERVGIHPQTYAALAAGFGCNGSTVSLVEVRLEANKEGGDE
jgi:topoisomerase IA-like protein